MVPVSPSKRPLPQAPHGLRYLPARAHLHTRASISSIAS